MTIVKTLESIQKFLQNNVCSNIKLKKPSDKSMNTFELITPNVFIMNLPPKNHLPEGIKSAIPCLICYLDDGLEEALQAELNIRINVITYNPGLHILNDNIEPVCSPNGEGWRDLLNLIDKILEELQKNQIINGVTIQYPIKWGTYQNERQNAELDAYSYGWITFPIGKKTYPRSEITRKLLD